MITVAPMDPVSLVGLQVISCSGANTNAPPRYFNETSLYDYDHFLWLLVCNQWSYESRPLPVADVFGYNDPAMGRNSYEIWEESIVPLLYNAGDDWRRFASKTSGLPMTFRVLAGSKTFSFAPGRQTQMYHWQMRGKFGPSAVLEALDERFAAPDTPYQQNLYCSYRLKSISKPTPVAISGWMRKAWYYSPIDYMEFAGGVPSVRGSRVLNSNVAVTGRRISDALLVLQQFFSERPLGITEELDEGIGGGAVRRWSVTTADVKLALAFESDGDWFPTLIAQWSTTASAADGSSYQLSSMLKAYPSYKPTPNSSLPYTGSKRLSGVGNMKYDYQSQLMSASGPIATTFAARSWTPGSWKRTSVNKTTSDTPGPRVYFNTTTGHATEVKPVAVRRVRNKISDFRAGITAIWPHIEAAAYFSAVPAVDDAMNALETSQLQSLVKLKDIMSSFDIFKESIAILRKAKSGDVIGTTRDLLNWAASANLVANFQYRPQFAFVTDFVPRWVDAMNAVMRDGGDFMRGTGSFTYLYPPGTAGRESLYLDLSTKLDIYVGGSPTIKALLGLKAMSLYPSPKLAWDLYPWSFVVNWGTNLGERMAAMETMAAGALLNVKCCTHVFRLTSPLNQADFDYLRAMRDVRAVESSNELRLVRRFTSAYVPAPRESKFDYGASSSPFNRWDLALSLVAQQVLNL